MPDVPEFDTTQPGEAEAAATPGGANDVLPSASGGGGSKRRRKFHARGQQRRAMDPPAPAPATSAAPAQADVPNDGEDEWPRDPGQLWLKVLSWLATPEGGEQGPEAVKIQVCRVRGGGFQGEPTWSPEHMTGDQVSGSDDESADAALMRALVDFYHVTMCKEGHRASYKIKFFFRATGKTIKESGAINLDPPDVLARQRERIQRVEPSTFFDGRMPQPTTTPRSRYAGGSPASATPSGATAALHEELGYLRAVRDEAERAQRENRPPRDIEPPPSVAVASQATSSGLAMDEKLSYEKRIHNMELEKKELENKHALERLQSQIDQLKNAPPPAPPAPAQSALTVEDVVKILDARDAQRAAQAPHTLEEQLQQMKKERLRKDRIKQMAKEEFGLEDADETETVTPQQVIVEGAPSNEMKVKRVPIASWQGDPILIPQYDPAEGEPGFVKRITEFLAANPKLSGDMVARLMEQAGQMLSSGAFGELIGKLAGQAVAGSASGAAVGAAAHARNGSGGGGGWSS